MRVRFVACTAVIVWLLALTSAASAASARVEPQTAFGSTDCVDGGPIAATLNETGLQSFRESLAKDATEPTDVLFVGDSESEGYNVTSKAATLQQDLRRDLQARYNPPGVGGGSGYLPLWDTFPPKYPTLWTVGTTDSGALPTRADLIGLAGRGGLLSGGQFAQTSFFGDRAHVLYSAGPTTWDMGVTVDDGPTQVVSTNQTISTSGQVWDSGPLDRGTHTLRVSPLAAVDIAGVELLQSIAVEGVMVFDGDGGPPGQGLGVRTWDGARSGSTALDYTSAVPPNWNSLEATVRPDLVVMSFGGNDINRYSPALFETYLHSVVQRYRQAPGFQGSILLWIEPNRRDKPPSEWQQYVDAIYRVAQSEHTGLADLYARFGSAVDSPFYSDTIHWSAAGDRMGADALGQTLGSVDCAPISGRLQDAAGSSVPAACVMATDAIDGSAVSYTRTADDGSYELATPPGNYKIKFWDCSGKRYLPGWSGGTSENDASVVAGSTSGLVDVAQPAVQTISGRVTNSTGSGVAGICVMPFDQATGKQAPIVQTAVDGSYATGTLSGASYLLAFWDCNKLGYQLSYHLNTSERAAGLYVPTGTVGLVDVLKPATPTISGRVMSASGKNVAGICVMPFDQASGKQAPIVQTAADGSYVTGALGGQSYVLAFWDCNKLGYELSYHLNTPERGKGMAVPIGAAGLVDVLKPATPTISGRVVSASGAKVAGICVMPFDQATGKQAPIVQTAADGSYVTGALGGKSYLLAFWDCNKLGYALSYHLNTPDRTKGVYVSIGTAGLVDVLQPAASASAPR